MPRTLKLILSYDGTNYCGWQVQPTGPTIQQAVERAMARVLNERIRVTASGRTDSGVHAYRQVASCQVESGLPTSVIRRALNGNLPADIRILEVAETRDDFHAIRDAIGKRYRYVIEDAEIPNVFLRNYAWQVRGRLDVSRMHEAGQGLVGRHDFVSFQAAGSDRKTSVRTITELFVRRVGEERRLIHLEVAADGFLYNMVRNITGTLAEVGLGNQDVSWPAQLLKARDRRLAGRTAPPQGLFMLQVTYPPDLE